MKHLTCRAMTFMLMASLPFAASLRADDGDAIRKVVESKSPSLVTVKFMLKMNFPGSDGQESEVETGGIVISEDGMVLCGNALLGGIVGIMSKMTGRDSQEVSMVPSDLKVLIGDDTEGLEAKLLARDSDLDLAWVKIKEPGDKKFAFVDIEKGGAASVGDSMVLLRRKSKFFDRTPIFVGVRAAGIATKPRNLILLEGDTGAAGSPVFTLGGDFAGFTIFQVPDSDEGSRSPMSQFTMGDVMFPVVLPAAEVAKATKNATAQ